MFENTEVENQAAVDLEPQWRQVDLTKDISRLPPKHEWIYDEDEGLLWFDKEGDNSC